MSRKAEQDTTLLYRSLEEQAKPYPVRAIRLTGKGPTTLGLLLLGNDSPGSYKRAPPDPNSGTHDDSR